MTILMTGFTGDLASHKVNEVTLFHLDSTFYIMNTLKCFLKMLIY